MRRSLPSLAIAIALTLACASGDDSGASDTGAMGAAAGGETRSFQLAAQGDSGVSGNVRVTPQGSSSALAIHIMGTAGTYTGHVHQGSCGTAGESAVVADLGTATIPAGGMLDHAATVSISADSLTNGQYFVGFHRDAGGPHVACAELR